MVNRSLSQLDCNSFAKGSHKVRFSFVFFNILHPLKYIYYVISCFIAFKGKKTLHKANRMKSAEEKHLQTTNQAIMAGKCSALFTGEENHLKTLIATTRTWEES